MSPSHRKITPKKPKRSRLPTEPDTPHAPASARSDVPNLSASTKRQSVHLPKSEAETLRFYVLAHWTLVTAELPSSLFRTSFPGVSQGWIPGTLSTESLGETRCRRTSGLPRAGLRLTDALPAEPPPCLAGRRLPQQALPFLLGANSRSSGPPVWVEKNTVTEDSSGERW